MKTVRLSYTAAIVKCEMLRLVDLYLRRSRLKNTASEILTYRFPLSKKKGRIQVSIDFSAPLRFARNDVGSFARNETAIPSAAKRSDCHPERSQEVRLSPRAQSRGLFKITSRSDSLIRRLKNLQLDDCINSTYNAPKLMLQCL